MMAILSASGLFKGQLVLVIYFTETEKGIFSSYDDNIQCIIENKSIYIYLYEIEKKENRRTEIGSDDPQGTR